MITMLELFSSFIFFFLFGYTHSVDGDFEAGAFSLLFEHLGGGFAPSSESH